MPNLRIPKKTRGGPFKGSAGGGGRGGGGGGRGRGGHGGGGRGGRSFYDGRMGAFGTDRFCTACGTSIIGLATTLEGKCPHCEEKVPYIHAFDQEFDADGWGRCRNCKSFMTRKMVYCQACQYCQCVNVVGKERGDRLKRQQLMSEKARMQKLNEEKDAKIARLEAQCLELNQVVGMQERQLIVRAPTGNVLDNMETDDELLSQIDESKIVLTKTPANDGSKIDETTAGDSTGKQTTAGSSKEEESPEGD